MDSSIIMDKKILKEAILAGFFCWLLVSIFLLIISVYLKIKYFKFYWDNNTMSVYLISPIVLKSPSIVEVAFFLILCVNPPLIFFFLIIGFYFGIKSIYEGRRSIISYFEVFCFLIIGWLIVLIIVLAFKKSFEMVEILKIFFLLSLLLYSIAVPTTLFLTKKKILGKNFFRRFT
jgi:hypothetical protein